MSCIHIKAIVNCMQILQYIKYIHKLLLQLIQYSIYIVPGFDVGPPAQKNLDRLQVALLSSPMDCSETILPETYRTKYRYMASEIITTGTYNIKNKYKLKKYELQTSVTGESGQQRIYRTQRDNTVHIYVTYLYVQYNTLCHTEVL